MLNSSSRVLVVGGGIVGLTTARELQRRGASVTVIARERGTEATSGGAGGYHMPFHAEPMEKILEWSETTLATYLAERDEGSKLGSCVEPMPAFVLFASDEAPEGPPWGASPLVGLERLAGATLADELERAAGPSPPAAYRSAWRFSTVVVDAPAYLGILEDELKEHGAEVSYGQSLNWTATRSLGFDAVVNCCGLGGSEFAGDAEGAVVPGRGVVAQFLRPPGRLRAVMTTEDDPLATKTEPAYCIPRGDVVVVGGTFHEGNFDTGHTPEEIARIKRTAAAMAPHDLAGQEPIQVWTGLRPVRSAGVRLEASTEDGVVLAHNYGHGGSGWTIAHGCAVEIADLIFAA